MRGLEANHLPLFSKTTRSRKINTRKTTGVDRGWFLFSVCGGRWEQRGHIQELTEKQNLYFLTMARTCVSSFKG